MAETSAGVVDPARGPETTLEPNAIGVVQDTVIGMASSAPAATVGLTLASLAATTAYGSGPILLLTAIPMLIIANAYRRLNMWNAHAGASFEWVGRAINPYLGFLTGWLMVVAYIIGTVSAVEVIGPSVITVFGGTDTPGKDFAIAAAVGLVMLVIAIVGIKITARAQIAMGVTEWAILLGFAVAGLVVVLGHHPGTFPVTSGWLSPSGIGGHGDAVGGFLAAVFVYGGWDGTLYVNEETTRRHINPGRAALLAVGLLTVLYVGCQIGLQGVVSPAKLQANSDSALVYVAHALGGGGWAKVMALAIALSVVATTGTGIV
ncbi:MAG TPA: APC family permease, partial [Streptosporangiaceae bacterium]|nr:APC family permease [Streptosporangiaceae bacterium]